jgi:hypothetical protein
MDTFTLISYCEKNGIEHGLNTDLLRIAAKEMSTLSF